MCRKKKKEIARKEAEEREIRIIEEKNRIKQMLRDMKKQLFKLESYKKDYIDEAREAKAVGNIPTYEAKKEALKICLSKQKYIEEVISKISVSFQINEMTKIMEEVANTINSISSQMEFNQMKSATVTLNMAKAQQAYETALANEKGRNEVLDAFLSSKSDKDDEEIEKLIQMPAINAEELNKKNYEKISAIIDNITV